MPAAPAPAVPSRFCLRSSMYLWYSLKVSMPVTLAPWAPLPFVRGADFRQLQEPSPFQKMAPRGASDGGSHRYFSPVSTEILCPFPPGPRELSPLAWFPPSPPFCVQDGGPGGGTERGSGSGGAQHRVTNHRMKMCVSSAAIGGWAGSVFNVALLSETERSGVELTMSSVPRVVGWETLG